MLLGGGRLSKEDTIDMSAGIILNKKANDSVKKGELLATCYSDKVDVEEALNQIKNAFEIE